VNIYPKKRRTAGGIEIVARWIIYTKSLLQSLAKAPLQGGYWLVVVSLCSTSGESDLRLSAVSLSKPWENFLRNP
jgi:hypothetical protein